MIDTHCHLTDPRLFDPLEGVLSRAAAAGVGRMITIGTDVEDSKAAVALARAHCDRVGCVVGVHPNYCRDVDVPGAIAGLRELAQDRLVLALGEMGLDYFHKDASPDRQAEMFRAQLRLAQEAGKPVVIHCREAIDEALLILEEFASIPALFHCFTGTSEQAARITDAGHLLGFTGAITYKRNDELRRAVRQTSLDRMVVETDAPYLSPEPLRSQRINEPALVIHVAAVVAREKQVSLDELDRITTANAERFFRWPGEPSPAD